MTSAATALPSEAISASATRGPRHATAHRNSCLYAPDVKQA